MRDLLLKILEAIEALLPDSNEPEENTNNESNEGGT